MQKSVRTFWSSSFDAPFSDLVPSTAGIEGAESENENKVDGSPTFVVERNIRSFNGSLIWNVDESPRSDRPTSGDGGTCMTF